MKLFLLLLFVLVISAVTHDGIGRRRARAASKYDLNPQLSIAEHKTTYEAREEQRDREEKFGWDDEDDTDTRKERRASLPEVPVDTVVIATFGDPGQAYLLRGALESTGIPAAAIAPPPRGDAHYRVLVARERVEEALEVVADLRQSWGDGT